MRYPSTHNLPVKLLGIACAGIGVMLAAQAADVIKPNIKPGLWEVTTHPKISGQMPIPEEQLAKMPPERRARIEAAMQAGMAGAAKPHVYKECMTPEKIARGFDIDRQGDDSNCTRKVVTSSSSEIQLHDECLRSVGKTVSDVHVKLSGGTQMTGTINVVITSGEKTTTIDSSMEGKWLGASCGSVKDAEQQK